MSTARVNAELIAGIESAYRLERHFVEQPEPIQATLEELTARTLMRPRERLLWADAIAANAQTLGRLSVEEQLRHEEMARRLGYPDVDAIVAPAQDPSGWCERLLTATDEAYRELVPKGLVGWLDGALALSADRGWPAQLNARSIQALVDAREWTEGLQLPRRHLPRPIAPASFPRALHEFGTAVAEASIPTREPFVLAVDPYGLGLHVAGALCAQLTALPRWQIDRLGLPSSRAVEQARAMRVAGLVHGRTSALALLLSLRARHGTSTMVRDFEELSVRALGFALPRGLAGVWPRLRLDAGQRLIAPWLATTWTRQLTQEYDEDWYRNPRGIAAVRERLTLVHPTEVPNEQLGASLADYTAALAESF